MLCTLGILARIAFTQEHYLIQKKIPYQEINVWEDESKRAEMLKKSGGRTSVPQIFIGDHHVGGNAELQAANKSGELDKLLA